MDRQKRTTNRVTDYRKFHLSGDLDQVVQGKVSEAVGLLENLDISMSSQPISEDATNEELECMLKEQRDNSARMQQQVENMKLRNALEAERLQQEQWEAAMDELKQCRDDIKQQHEQNLEKIRKMREENTIKSDQAVAWMQAQLKQLGGLPAETQEELQEEPSQDQLLIDQLQKQQQELQKQINDIKEGHNPGLGRSRPLPGLARKSQTEQEVLLEQIRTTLAPKEVTKDPNKVLLKALITAQNKVTGNGGTSTLPADTLNRLTGEAEFSMAEWLASLNKQEEGESEVNRILNKIDEDSGCRAECRHSKTRSGMLDKSTTNIKHKEIWPQRNIGEDWAEEEIEFKQLRFEHLVAGETRTIETCSDPAQILGRLRLLRRIAYLKLRGIERYLLRKMYAAILSLIETAEYSWESNFDRFESILFRKVLSDRTGDRDHRDRDREPKQQEGRKRYCKDYKSDGCPRTSPHTAWLSTGNFATKRTVYHYCATCLVKERIGREHPEGHSDCPHRA